MDIQKSEQHIYSTDMTFLNQAEAIKQELIHSVHHARHQVTLSRNPECVHGWQCLPAGDIQALAQRSLHKGDSCIVDFGDHQVGYVSLQIRPVGSPPDAPLHLRLTFGEMPVELAEPFAGYDGWVSSSWLQEETLHIDVLPCLLRLPRRYSFRYLKLEILDTSPKYGVAFEQIQCDTVSSADVASVLPLPTNDPMLTALDRISMKTLHDCMQQVFEDGPKRDRRLWLGDLRLQALANYQTFRNYDLVRRCLYLFAAVTNEQGQVSANVFLAPCLIPDDTYLYDYSLFFVVSLFDYYQETADRETLTALWPTACRQIELALARVDARGLVRDATDGTWWAFVDWHPELNKQASAQGILIYTLHRARQLAVIMADEARMVRFSQLHEQCSVAARDYLWDTSSQFFVSGDIRQVSWASQIWMVLGGVLDETSSFRLMQRLLNQKPDIRPVTPYMYHHLIDALICVGDMATARQVMENYWGGMVRDGADTFWEAYDPDDKNFSPYGNYLINSYCHAWSCTPTYFIRKYHMG